ncbi:MAG: FUSC family protein, partial [Oxalobacteraceae bacterium]|nr:FUSC family protein [Oxalobacteraceae bacterium]
MTRPDRSEILYSFKCFGAAMLALYVAFRIGLPRPFWAMMTAYVVANPLSGLVRSKAVYRFAGTLLGSGATVLLVPQLGNSPELLSLALAGWVGACLYLSLLDRTPRSYVFMLAGYTAGLIAFPVVADPSTVFDVALARVEEISLGIACATLIHSLVFPQSVGPVLLARVDHAIDDARRWIREALTAAPEQQGKHARWSLAGDITELRVMSTHLPFDTSHLRWMSGSMQALHDQLALMVPLLSAIEDRLDTLRRLDPASVTDDWQALLADIAQWSDQTSPSADKTARLRAGIKRLTPAIGRDASWSTLLQLNLATRLHALVDATETCLRLRRRIDDVLQGRGPIPSVRPDRTAASALHLDHGLALRSAFAAFIAILVCSAFWIVTGWPSGAAAPTMAAVFCCFFATQDDPVPGIRMFLNYTMLSIPISAFYLLVV